MEITLRKLRFYFIGTAVFLSGLSMSVKAQQNNGKIQEIISKMTLEQKAKMVVGQGRRMMFPPNDSTAPTPPPPEPGDTRNLVPGAAGTTAHIDELGITTMVLSDGPAGLRIQPTREGDNQTYYCTAFPVATVLASTWDTTLVREVGVAMGNETLEYGADILLAPAMNIQRNPLDGRNFEYYSEDPVVSGMTAAAFVRGAQSQGVGTSIKHFVANNQETNRGTVNTVVSKRALREIYLRGFHIAIEGSHPWTVMSSYNKLNGTYTSESHGLITDVLRNDWGFKGFVMTDWGGGRNPIAQMKAGNDLLMPGNPSQSEAIVNAVKAGKLDEKVLDQNVARILKIMMKTPRYNNYPYTNKPDLKAHAKVTRQVATDGMVLLKDNDQALPLNKNMKEIAVFGNTSYNIIKGGTGSGNVNAAYTVDLIEGLNNAGYTVNAPLKDIYDTYIKEETAKQPKPEGRMAMFRGAPRIGEMPVDAATAEKFANTCDVALITIGRISGEGRDRQVEGDFDLTDTEKAMIKTVSQAFQAKGKKAIVILNIGGVIETASWKNDPDAILLAWQPGQEAGNSIADVISGKVNPSGKLAVTFPMSYSDVPSAKYFPGIELPDTSKSTEEANPFRGTPARVVYDDDIYVGYRYYTTFKVPVSYEFGYGLSYTQFQYGKPKISSKTFNDNIEVSVDVKNTGKVAGREVVELYLSAPKGKLNKPAEELKEFDKTKLLAPGETQTIHLTISKEDLASFDESSSAWIADAGNYEIRIGASSKDIRQTASFNLPQQLVVRKVSDVLAPDRKMNLLKP